MVVRSPPFQVGEQLWGLLSRGPSSTRQCCHSMSDRQIHPFNESRVQPTREA